MRVSLSSCLRKRILFNQPPRAGFFISAVILLSSSVTAPAMALEWQVDTSTRNSRTVEQTSDEIESQEILSSQELIQTLRGLELVEVFNFPTAKSEEVKRVQNDLREIARQSSSPYQIPQSQLQGLRSVFSSLSEEQLTAVNQMLLIQQAENSLRIAPKNVEVLELALKEIPESNLTQSQKQQLTVIRLGLSEVSQQEGATFSSKNLERLQSAIAQVFFTPDTRASQTASQAETTEGTLVANLNFQSVPPNSPTTQRQNNRQSIPNNASPKIAQSQLREFQRNLATHLNNSNEESRNLILSTLVDSGIPQEDAEPLVSSIENMFQEVQGGEILFRIEMAKRLQEARNTFNEVVETLDTETLKNPPNFLLIIRDIINEVVVATRAAEDPELAEQLEESQELEELPSGDSASRQELVDRVLIPEPETEEVIIAEDRAVPALGINVPSGFGIEWGQVFAGVAYQASTRPVPPSTEPERDDAAFAMGMGFGDPNEAVGLEAAYTSFSTFRSGPFNTGSFSFKLHRRLGNSSSVALGAENLIQYGGTDGQTSYYGSFTNIFNLTDDPTDNFSRLAVTAGLGSGRFREFQDALDDKDTINFFGSVGLQIAEPVSLVSSYNGQTLTIGTSVAPFKNIPIIITPSVTDLTGDFIDSPRFVITIGYGTRLFNKD